MAKGLWPARRVTFQQRGGDALRRFKEPLGSRQSSGYRLRFLRHHNGVLTYFPISEVDPYFSGKDKLRLFVRLLLPANGFPVHSTYFLGAKSEREESNFRVQIYETWLLSLNYSPLFHYTELRLFSQAKFLGLYHNATFPPTSDNLVIKYWTLRPSPNHPHRAYRLCPLL